MFNWRMVLCLTALPFVASSWQEQVLPPEQQWPAGALNCPHGLRDFDPLTQKRVYHVGVHAPAGIDTAWREFNLTFEEYLDRTVGDRWVPPIRFKMKPTVDPLKDWVDNEEDVDFMYSDTGKSSGMGLLPMSEPNSSRVSHWIRFPVDQRPIFLCW